MVERRTLLEGLKNTPSAIDPKAEKDFVYHEKPGGGSPSTSSIALSRTPLSTKLREDFAKALKRASLERKLHGQEPNTVQDILEESLEPWLKKHGYLL